MAVRIAKLSADLDANTSSFEAGLNRAGKLLGTTKTDMQKKLKGIDDAFGGLGSTATDFIKTLTGVEAGLAGLASGAGLALLIKGATDSATAIKNQSESLNLSTDAFQEYVYAAKQSGISQEDFVTGITKLNAKIADGSLHYKNASDAILAIADATKSAKDGVDKLAIVNDAFGAKTGAKFIPLLNQGADGLRQLADEAAKAGSVLSSDTVQAAAKFGDALDTVGKAIKTSFQQGFLDAFVGQGKDLKAVFTDPELIKGLQNFGALIGDAASWALKAAAAIGELAANISALKISNSNGSSITGAGLNDADLAQAIKDSQALLSYAKDRQKAEADINALIAVQSGRRATELAQEISDQQKLLPYAKDRETAEANINTLILERQKLLQSIKPPAPATAPQTAPTAPKVTQLPATHSDYNSAENNKALEDQANAIDDVFNNLEKENDALQAQTDMYGKNKGAIEAVTKAIQIKYDLDKQGVTLSKQDQADLQDELTTYQQLIDKQKAQQKQTEAQKKTDEEWAQGFNKIETSISNDFEEMLKGGKKFSDLLGDLVSNIEELAIKMLIVKPLTESIFGVGGGGGGILSSIGSALGFSFGSHAAGISYVNRDSVVRVHKGEEIVNRRDVGAGGGGMQVNIQNNNPDNNVQAAPSSNGEGLDVVIDRVVGQKMAKRGSSTNSAMRSQIGQTLIRR